MERQTQIGTGASAFFALAGLVGAVTQNWLVIAPLMVVCAGIAVWGFWPRRKATDNDGVGTRLENQGAYVGRDNTGNQTIIHAPVTVNNPPLAQPVPRGSTGIKLGPGASAVGNSIEGYDTGIDAASGGYAAGNRVARNPGGGGIFTGDGRFRNLSNGELKEKAKSAAEAVKKFEIEFSSHNIERVTAIVMHQRDKFQEIWPELYQLTAEILERVGGVQTSPLTRMEIGVRTLLSGNPAGMTPYTNVAFFLDEIAEKLC